MRLFFAGADQPVSLTLLLNLEVQNVALSFYEWRKRHADYDLSRIPGHLKICLTPGVARKEGLDWELFTRDYIEFIEENVQNLAQIFDIDAHGCPPKFRNLIRERFVGLQGFVVFPTHEESLPELAAANDLIGINATTAKAVPLLDLRRLPAKLCGSNITSQRTLLEGRFHSSVTHAWIAGRRYGDLYIWSGGKLHHHPAGEIPQVIRQYRRAIEGFDVDPESLSAQALTTLAVKSMLAMETHLTGRVRDHITDIASETPELLPMLMSSPDPATSSVEVPEERERVVLPNMVLEGPPEQPRVASTPASIRSCDSCFLSGVCPKYAPRAACAYELPVKFDSQDQVRAACQALLEVQWQRAMFGAFAEQAQGGSIDVKVSKEIELFYKALGQISEIAKNTDERPAGILSEIMARLDQEEKKEMILDAEETQEEGPK